MRVALMLYARPADGFKSPAVNLRADGVQWNLVCEGLKDTLLILRTQDGIKFPITHGCSVTPGSVSIEIEKAGSEQSISVYAESLNGA